MPTQSTCVTCGRQTARRSPGECHACAEYRRRHGVTRPIGQNGRAPRTGMNLAASAAARAAHPLGTNWKGDRAKRSAGWARAKRVLPLLGACQECGSRPARDRHHKDGNPLNNAPENTAALCRRCHMRLDGRLDRMPQATKRSRQR